MAGGRDRAVGARLDDDGAGPAGQRPRGLVVARGSRDAHRLLGVRQEGVGHGQQVEEAAAPAFGRVPVGVDGRGRAVRPDAFEQLGQARTERLLQEVGGDVDVPRRFEQAWADPLGAQVGDRARPREDRSVVPPGKDDGQAGRPSGFDDQAGHVDPPALELVAHEPPEHVVAHDAADRRSQAEAGGAARDDRAGPADGQVRVVDDPLDLAERGLDVADQEQIGVDVAEDQQIDRIRHGRTIAEAVRRPAPSTGAGARGGASIVRA